MTNLQNSLVRARRVHQKEFHSGDQSPPALP